MLFVESKCTHACMHAQSYKHGMIGVIDYTHVCLYIMSTYMHMSSQAFVCMSITIIAFDSDRTGGGTGMIIMGLYEIPTLNHDCKYIIQVHNSDRINLKRQEYVTQVIGKLWHVIINTMD